MITDLGNCRHYWRFDSANFSSMEWADQIGSSPFVLNTGSPSYELANGLETLDLSSQTQFLRSENWDAIGEISVITVLGYRGGGSKYGLSSEASTSGFNAYQFFVSLQARWWRSSGATTGADLVNAPGSVNVFCCGSRIDSGLNWAKIDEHPEVTNAATPSAPYAIVNNAEPWVFGRQYTNAINAVQILAEMAVYIGDVSTDPNFDTEIQALKTKYAIP